MWSFVIQSIVGATVVTRAIPWALSTNTATAYDAGTHKITLSGNVHSTYVMRTGYGFYLQNKLSMLDAPGEWFYATSTGMLYLWTANGDDPTSHTVEVSNRSYGVNTSGKNYITIQNLNVKNANLYDVAATSSNNIIINNLNISGGQTGVYVATLATSTISSNSIQNTLSDGIQTSEGIVNSNINISSNIINNAGNVGISPKQSNGSMYLFGTTLNVDSNNITNSGYIGISFYGNLNTIQNNIIDMSCLVLEDCGGIYTYARGYTVTNNTISGNTIKNSIGNSDGINYGGPYTAAHGIYLDRYSINVNIMNNVIYNIDWGIIINSGYGNTVTSNKVYGARRRGLFINEYVDSLTYDNSVTDNIFEMVINNDVNRSPVYYSSSVGNTFGFGTYNNNQYCHPNSNYVVKNKSIDYTLSAWQTYSGQDANSTDTTAYCSRPVLTTSSASSIRTGTATLNGNTTNKGYDLSTLRGFEYSTSPSMETIIATTTDSGSFDTGTFTKNLTDLTLDTTYYYRAYSTNTAGTTLGNIESFRTQSAPRSSGGSTAQSRVNNLLAMGNTTLANQIAQQYNIVIPNQAVAPVTNKTPTFSRYLQLGQTGNDVKQLQIFLNSKGYTVSPAGPGSKGNETTMFGSLTKKALMKYQKDNKISATGYFGPITRKFVNEGR